MTFIWAYAVGIGLAVLAVTLAIHLAWHRGVHPRPWIAVAQRLHIHLSLAVICAVVAGFLAGVFAVTGYAILYGPHGIITPPVPAQKPHGAKGGGKHGLGFIPQRRRRGRPHTFSAVPVPASVDLSQYAPPVGNQGAINSCASWAVGYGLRDWYANRDGHPLPGNAAPMYLYSQASGGINQGTSFPSVYAIVAQQGLDSRAHYYQGDYDYIDQPTSDERANAASWRSLGYQSLFVGQGQGTYAQQAIEQALAGGDPVTVGIPVYDNFYQAGPRSYFIAGIAGNYYGGHALAIYRYDENGAWAENSWGTIYGLNGWIELSWSFINTYALEADQMVMPHPAPQPLPTPPPRPRPHLPPRPHPTPRPPHRRAQPRAGYYLLLHAELVRLHPVLQPATTHLLRAGLRLHATGRGSGRWWQFYVPGGVGWLLSANMRRTR